MAHEFWQAMREKQVCTTLGISRATLRRWVSQGNFPKPFRLGSNTVAWDSRVVLAWMNAKSENVGAAK